MNKFIEVRQKAGLTQKQVAQRLGVATMTVSQYEMGRRTPRTEVMERYAEVFNIPVSYFEHEDVRLVPKFSDAAAGPGCWTDGIPEEYLILPKSLQGKGDFFAVDVKGDSMSPYILNGDLLFVKKQNFIERNGQIAIITVGEDVRVKKISLTEEGMLVESINKEYPPELHKGDVFINGVVKMLVRNLEN